MRIFIISYLTVNLAIFFFILLSERREKFNSTRFLTKKWAIIGILCPLAGLYFLSSAYYKKQCVALQKELREQVKYYERMCRADRAVRTFMHDYRNLRIGLQSYLKEKDAEGALQYLLRCEKDYIGDIICFETGNGVLDALLSEKQRAAEEFNAKIVFDGILPNDGIHPADICAVFGNALDNAIEACSLLESKARKTISITANMNNNFLFVTIENPIRRHMPGTQKDKKSHGLGLSSIQYAVKKYDGTCKIFADNRIFRLALCFDFHAVI